MLAETSSSTANGEGLAEGLCHGKVDLQGGRELRSRDPEGALSWDGRDIDVGDLESCIDARCDLLNTIEDEPMHDAAALLGIGLSCLTRTARRLR